MKTKNASARRKGRQKGHNENRQRVGTSITLRPLTLEKIDAIAIREHRCRSKQIEAFLEAAVSQSATEGA